MTDLFTTGLPADLALAVIVIEAIVLALMNRRGRGPRLASVAPFLLAGAGFALALRSALVGAPWWCVAAALLASGVAHAVDLRLRLRR